MLLNLINKTDEITTMCVNYEDCIKELTQHNYLSEYFIIDKYMDYEYVYEWKIKDNTNSFIDHEMYKHLNFEQLKLHML